MGVMLFWPRTVVRARRMGDGSGIDVVGAVALCAAERCTALLRKNAVLVFKRCQISFNDTRILRKTLDNFSFNFIEKCIRN